MRTLMTMIAAVAVSFALTACDQGPAEKVGENIDEFGEDAKQKADETGEAIEEKYEETQE